MEILNQDWLRRWKCFHFHNHVSRMEGDVWRGIECLTLQCGERFSADEYRLFAGLGPI
jgi:hypothetical protein